MRDLFLGAKKKYDSIDIPPELCSVVEDALKNEKSIYPKRQQLIFRYASVAACVLLCVMISVGYFFSSGNDLDAVPSETSTGFVLKGRSTEAPDVKCDTAIEEASAAKSNIKPANEERAEMTELYSDDEVLSYSITFQPSNITNYYNIRQTDGEEITLESLIGEDSEFNSENSSFYFKSKNELVVICDGAKKIIKLK